MFLSCCFLPLLYSLLFTLLYHSCSLGDEKTRGINCSSKLKYMSLVVSHHVVFLHQVKTQLQTIQTIVGNRNDNYYYSYLELVTNKLSFVSLLFDCCSLQRRKPWQCPINVIRPCAAPKKALICSQRVKGVFEREVTSCMSWGFHLN